MNGGPGFSQFLSFSQSYTYDGVNRLSNAVETGHWGRGFDYDVYGNMWVNPASARTFGIGLAGTTPTSNVYVPASGPPTNRRVGSNYDSGGNGNMSQIANDAFLYDAENRQKQTTD